MAAMLLIAGSTNAQGTVNWWNLYAEAHMYIVPAVLAVLAVLERSAPPQTCRDTAGTGTQVQHPQMWAGDVQGEIDYLRPPDRRISY